jgi:Peptidase_C39 like family
MKSILRTTAAALAAASVIGFAGPANAAPAPSVGHGQKMYGDPAAAAPFWRRQHGSDCGEMAVADVVGEVTGKEPAEPQIKALAQNTPSSAHPGPIWQPGGSTHNRDLPVLLSHYGVRSDMGLYTLDGIEQYLAQGRKVIAGVNSETLWNQRGDRSLEDHFVVVTGIDTRSGMVHLNDSGADAGRDEQVPLAAFERSWATSNNFAVVTS